MADYLKQHYPEAHYRAVYEAGKFGFWIPRQLTALGIECLVVTILSLSPLLGTMDTYVGRSFYSR